MKISMPNLQNIPKVPSFLKGSKLSSTLSFFKGVIFALGLCVGVGAVLAAPPGNPPTCPNTNPACIAPINSGIANITQFINLGGLWVNSLGAQSLTVGTAPTTVGQPLVATNTTGGVGWGAVSPGESSSMIIKTGETPMSICYNCTKAVLFNVPFPAGVIPNVTAQPKWTKDNGGEHSTWRVDNVSNTGFTIAVTGPNGGSAYGEANVMWSAYYNPGSLSGAYCTSAVRDTDAVFYVYTPNSDNVLRVDRILIGGGPEMVDYNPSTHEAWSWPLSRARSRATPQQFIITDLKFENVKTIDCPTP